MTLATLIHQCVFGPIGHGTTRFWSPAEEADDLPAYLLATRNVVTIATGFVILGGVLVAAGLVVADYSEWALMALLASGFALLRGYNSILGGMQNAARQRVVVALHQGAEPWMRFLLAAILIVWIASSGTVAIGGYVAAMLIVLASQALFFRARLGSTESGVSESDNWRRQIWQFGWPFAAFGLFTWAQVASARWALEVFASTDDVGLFAVLFQLGIYPMSILTAMVIQYLAPILYQRAGDASDRERIESVQSLVARLTVSTISLTLIATLAAFSMHEWIFRWLVAKEYASVSYMLPWLVFAGGLIAAAQTIELNLMSLLKTRSMLWAKVVTAVIGVLLNLYGARYYGTIGVVMANVAFAVPYFSWMLILRNRVAKHTVINA